VELKGPLCVWTVTIGLMALVAVFGLWPLHFGKTLAFW